MTSAPAHPALGVPEERLREMASIDWHAGHPEAPECPTRLTDTREYCRCQTPEVLGDFAVRFLTGQAQLSSTREGGAAYVSSYDVANVPQMYHYGERTGEPLAGLIVRGDITMRPCEAPACELPSPHDSPVMTVTGMSLLAHPDIDNDDAVVALLGEHLTWLIEQRPTDADDAPGQPS